MKVFLLGVLLICGSVTTQAQSCLTPDDINQVLARVDSATPATVNTKLQAQLIKLATAERDALQQIVSEDHPKESEKKTLTKLYDANTRKLCEILKTNGWPTTALVDREGVYATFYILRNSTNLELQRALFPVILAAVKKDPVQKPELATLFDSLRISAGLKQIFGTQAVSREGFLVLYPIQDETKVDALRAQFGLPDLEANIRDLERTYGRPLIKARQPPSSYQSKQVTESISKELDPTALDPTYVAPSDVIKTDTNLVSLNVSVVDPKSKLFIGSLTKDDFKVVEDGQQQTVTYFASTDVPFDLVLLIDLSGSTADKRDLIKISTLRFIEAARPTDRLAIVTFSDEPTVLCPLTLDRAQLKASVEKIEGMGDSNVWDAIKFTLDKVVGPKTLERRRAVLLMSDGVDSALYRQGRAARGSKTTFADLVEEIRQNDTLIVPIYLDTEQVIGNPFDKTAYENARRTLNLMAQESGGSYYKARKLSDLNGVYQQVIDDLGKVYSLGYKPTNSARDGTWRSVQISIVNRPDLVARARPGYYAQ